MSDTPHDDASDPEPRSDRSQGANVSGTPRPAHDEHDPLFDEPPRRSTAAWLPILARKDGLDRDLIDLIWIGVAAASEATEVPPLRYLDW